MPRSLLFLTPQRFEGENRGVYVQHIATMRCLLADSDWHVSTSSIQEPEFASAALSCDLLVVHMLSHPAVEAVIRLRRYNGLPTVFEISDNFLHLGEWLPRRSPLRNPLVRQSILFHAWLCDALQVYAAPLKDLFGAVNENVVVLDPYVPISATRCNDRRNGPFVFGWGGTTSHEVDLVRIAPDVVEFCKLHPDAIFAYMGNEELFMRLFGAIDSRQVRARPFSSHDEYLTFLRSWDVGLAPLLASPFNNGRTDSKFGTYAACCIAAVLERHPVHEPHAQRALLFNEPHELRSLLQWLHNDRTRVHDYAMRAHAWARQERNAERLRQQRLALYNSLIEGCEPSPTARLIEGAKDRLREAMTNSPLVQLRKKHQGSSDRIGYFQAVLELQPYDYIALRNVIDYAEEHEFDVPGLSALYERMCFLLPESVPHARRPHHLDKFLP
jgi:hypothetical protein